MLDYGNHAYNEFICGFLYWRFFVQTANIKSLPIFPFGIAFTDFYGFLNFICLNCDNYAIVYTSLPEADRTSFHKLRFSPW